MERTTDTLPIDIVDLGQASIETKGPPEELNDSQGGISVGISDD